MFIIKKGMFITVLIPDSYKYLAVQDSSNSLEKLINLRSTCHVKSRDQNRSQGFSFSPVQKQMALISF